MEGMRRICPLLLTCSTIDKRPSCTSHTCSDIASKPFQTPTVIALALGQQGLRRTPIDYAHAASCFTVCLTNNSCAGADTSQLDPSAVRDYCWGFCPDIRCVSQGFQGVGSPLQPPCMAGGL